MCVHVRSTCTKHTYALPWLCCGVSLCFSGCIPAQARVQIEDVLKIDLVSVLRILKICLMFASTNSVITFKKRVLEVIIRSQKLDFIVKRWRDDFGVFAF